MKPISDKLKEWDFKTDNSGIISVQNGIGKTHLATLRMEEIHTFLH